MRQRLACLASLLLAPTAGSAADLTALEQRWLQGIRPVIAFARASRLPLDIIVQPQPTPGASPLAMAFVDGRCKMVFSMRGNPEAQSTLDRIAPPLLGPTLELMAAHELAHCQRHLDGAWNALPAGFARQVAPEAPAADHAAEPADRHAARREEGLADLTGLAWIQRQHPQHYAALYRWLLAERTTDTLPGSPHDTLAWLLSASDGSVFADPSIFKSARRLWASTPTR